MGTRHILGTTGFHGKKTSLKYSTMAAAWQKLADFFEAADLLVVLTHPGQVGEPHCRLYHNYMGILSYYELICSLHCTPENQLDATTVTCI
jgi:hypothetical protein